MDYIQHGKDGPDPLFKKDGPDPWFKMDGPDPVDLPSS
jgi:hypothetical protein